MTERRLHMHTTPNLLIANEMLYKHWAIQGLRKLNGGYKHRCLRLVRIVDGRLLRGRRRLGGRLLGGRLLFFCINIDLNDVGFFNSGHFLLPPLPAPPLPPLPSPRTTPTPLPTPPLPLSPAPPLPLSPHHPYPLSPHHPYPSPRTTPPPSLLCWRASAGIDCRRNWTIYWRFELKSFIRVKVE